MQAALAPRAGGPAAHLVEAGDVPAAHVGASPTEPAIPGWGPVHPDARWQAQAQHGGAGASCLGAWATPTVGCPPGRRRARWLPTHARPAQPVIPLRLARADGPAWAKRAPCPQAAAHPRRGTRRPPAQHAALQAAHPRQTTEECKGK
jgi:hypothetical protein